MNCLIFQSNFTSKQENNICSCSTVRKCLNLLRTIYCKPNFILLALGQNPEHHTKARTPPLNYTPACPYAWQTILAENLLPNPVIETLLSKSTNREQLMKKERKEKPCLKGSTKQGARQPLSAPTLSSSRLLEFSCWVMRSLPESSLMQSSRRDDRSFSAVAFSFSRSRSSSSNRDMAFAIDEIWDS